MAAKDTDIKENRWFHQDKPGNTVMALTMASGLVSFMVVLFLRVNSIAVVSTLPLVALIFMVVFLTQSKTTSIEINREKAEVIKSTNYRVFTIRKNYPLREFGQVKLLTVDQPVEDGYRTIRYSVVLSGAGRSLELLSVDTEGEGRAIRKELAEFLGLTAQGAADGRNEI